MGVKKEGNVQAVFLSVSLGLGNINTCANDRPGVCNMMPPIIKYLYIYIIYVTGWIVVVCVCGKGA